MSSCGLSTFGCEEEEKSKSSAPSFLGEFILQKETRLTGLIGQWLTHSPTIWSQKHQSNCHMPSGSKSTIQVCYQLAKEYLACVGYHRVYSLRQFRHLLLKILHPG